MVKRLVPLVLLAAVSCGDDSAAGGGVAPGDPGLAPNPKWITFRCVTPGCDTTETIRVDVLGARRLAVKRIVLDDDSRDDFEIVPDRRAPFIVGVEESFSISVRHLPHARSPRESAKLVVTYGDASDREEEGRVPPTDLEIPLIRRVVGEAKVRADPDRLVFGSVRPGDEKTLPLVLHNEGTGNVPLAVLEVLSDVEEIAVTELPVGAALPGTPLEVPVTFTPRREAYVEGKLLVTTADPELPPVEISVAGTSIVAPTLSFEPADGLDFGPIPRGMFDELVFTLVNEGGGPVDVTSIATSGSYPGLTVRVDSGEPPFTLEPLGRVDVTVALDAQVAGEVTERIAVASNGSFFPLDVPVRALVTEPDVVVSPIELDYGAVPRGWTKEMVVDVQNTGYGELEIQRLDMVLGSSDLFQLTEIPTLPARLARGERLPVRVEFRSEGEATFNGRLAVETNDPDSPFVEVSLTATGANCDAACSIPFATPTCAGGACAIASCDQGRFDADGDVTNGCECQDPNQDPGGFCAEAAFVGSLSDEGANANFSGVVPTADDVDFVRMHGKDDSQLWGEQFDVRIRLDSADPSVTMCVYRHDTANHVSECFLENETCGIRSYSRDGDYGSEDGADFVIKVYRPAGSPGSCASYTLSMSNG